LRDGRGHLRTQSRRRLRELRVIPRPAWDLTPIANYLDAGVMTGVNLGRSMPMLASRGCPYRCTFCSNPQMWGTLWRVRDPREVFDEMCDYADRYGAANFDFYDLTAIVRRDWIVAFCRLIIASGRKFTWQLPSGTRSEAIDEEVTRLLYESGCRYVNYAPESGSDEILERIKKRISKDKMLQSMRWAVHAGIKVKANFILGFPGERLRHTLETYRFILSMSLVGIHDISVFPFSPYPGSELFEFVRQRGDVALDEEYFLSLSQYTDPRYTKSYCENLSALTLRLLCLVAMGLFYLVSYLRRPARFVQLVRNVFFKQEGKTKLESALVRVIKKRRELKQQPRVAA
jgi:radical SAM superfamily enzyme YgiQ (UPF0313 family)